jgi:imidazolonepropionase-like amidohydrolase
MNNKILVYVTALLLSLNSFSEEILLKNATIHTATNQGSLENSDILIRDGYIVRIGENISSSSAIVVNLSGKEVSPGLIAPLSQLGIVELGLVPERFTTLADEEEIFSPILTIYPSLIRMSEFSKLP